MTTSVPPGPPTSSRPWTWLLALALLLVPALVCAVLAWVIPEDAAMLPMLGVAVLGSLGCGGASGFLMASLWVRERGARVVLGLVLSLACTGASLVASFAGCAAGAALQ